MAVEAVPADNIQYSARQNQTEHLADATVDLPKLQNADDCIPVRGLTPLSPPDLLQHEISLPPSSQRTVLTGRAECVAAVSNTDPLRRLLVIEVREEEVVRDRFAQTVQLILSLGEAGCLPIRIVSGCGRERLCRDRGSSVHVVVVWERL